MIPREASGIFSLRSSPSTLKYVIHYLENRRAEATTYKAGSLALKIGKRARQGQIALVLPLELGITSEAFLAFCFVMGLLPVIHASWVLSKGTVLALGVMLFLKSCLT
jgi:hypothetical protein